MEFKTLTDCFTLHNGVKIPCVGFGTWQTPDNETGRRAVKSALDAGYRHIDGAMAYSNEKCTGAALSQYGLPRAQCFITGKLSNYVRRYDEVLKAVDNTLRDLQTEYLDLYLLHWPNPITFRSNWAQMNSEAWSAMEELYNAGKIRAVGVSNFHAHHLDSLMATAEIKPMVNQIRLCPGDTQVEVVRASTERGLLVEAYSPLGGTGKANILRDAIISEIAAKHGKTTAQVCVRWCLQHGYLPLPKSENPVHIADNVKVFDFELDNQDMDRLDGLTGYPSPFPHPDEITW